MTDSQNVHDTPENSFAKNNELISLLWDEVKNVYDPDVGFSIVDLGLVYEIWVDNGKAYVLMTLTSLGCPAGPYLEHQVKEACKKVPGITDVEVQFTFDPPWDPRVMASEEIKMLLGLANT